SSSTKAVPSFVADDVLQRRLHLTTTSPSYVESLDSFFEDSDVSFDDDYENKTNYFPREVSSFRDYNHSVTDASDFGATLTTPRISIFDDFHDRLTEGIQQNLDTNEQSFRSTEKSDNPKYKQVHDPMNKEHENSDTNLQSIQNNSLSKQSVLEKSKSERKSSTNRKPLSDKNVIIKNTGTPGDKESTTSEPTRGRSHNRSRTQISNKISDNKLSESTIVTNNLETSTNSAVSDSATETNKNVSDNNNSRGGKMLILSHNQNSSSSTNIFDESSETPQFGSSENSLNRENIKKSRLRNGLRRTGFNRTEEQVDANTTTEAYEKTPATTKQSDENNYSTTEYSSSSRSRAFTFRRLYSGTSTIAPTTDGTTKTFEKISSTTKPNNVDTIRQRLSTLRRRLQTSTEPTYTVVSSSNFTTESNAIVRGWPGIPKRSSVPKLSPNGTVTESTENNEGNDIITRTNTFKPINRNRGAVRYGSQKNVNESSFPLPPSATAWTLVTLKGPGNESRSSQQSDQNDTSTISNSTTRVVATSVKWSPIRGNKLWTTLQQGM
ncbi:hypothetical protein L9F63_007190, partial [Diploptera punctata]